MSSFLRLAFLCALLFFLIGQKGVQDTEVESALPGPVTLAWLQAQEAILPANVRDIECHASFAWKADFGMKHQKCCRKVSGVLPENHPRMKWICTRYLEYKPLILERNDRSYRIPEKGEIPISA